MSLQLGDLGFIVNTAWRIWNRGSKNNNNAPQEYKDFLESVKDLGETVKHVELAAQQTVDSKATLDIKNETIQSAIEQAKNTLRVCESLIDKNGRFKKGTESFFTNIDWAVTIAGTVRQLQSRIQACSLKFDFILKRKAESNIIHSQEIGLQANLAGHKTTQKLLQTYSGSSSTNLLSPEIAERFTQSMLETSVNSNPTVAQRLDAIHLFYEESTHAFEPMVQFRGSQPCPTPTQYLNLLKCIWLLGNVKRDQVAFRNFCKNALNEAWAFYLEQKVEEEALRFLTPRAAVGRVSEEDLLMQPDSSFAVNPWPTVAPQLPNPLDTHDGERFLKQFNMRSQYPGCQETLHCFRVSEDCLRLVLSIARHDSSNSTTLNTAEKDIDNRWACIDPQCPTENDESSVVRWKKHPSDPKIHEFAFANLNDARLFQTYVTRFLVRYDSTGFAGGRVKSGKFGGQGKVLGKSGRIQIWVRRNTSEDDLVGRPTSVSESQSDRSDSINSTRMQRISRTMSNASSSTRESIASGRYEQAGVFFDDPEPSQIMILTEIDKVKRTISIPVDTHTRLMPERCGCSSDRTRCREIILKRSRKNDNTKKKLIVRTLHARSPNEGWNVAVFAREDHLLSNQIEKEEAEFVSLYFDSAETRQLFEDRFETACGLLEDKVNTYNRDLRRTRRMTISS